MSDLVQIPTDANQVTDADEEVWPLRGCLNFTMLTNDPRYSYCTLDWRRHHQQR